MKTLCIIAAIIAAMGIYHNDGYIREIDPVFDSVIVETIDGNLWEFEGSAGWEIGNECKLTMYDNGTADSVYDDIIMEIQPTGE